MDAGSIFPPLGFSGRTREFNCYNEQERAAAVYHYLVSGMSFRKLDDEVLCCRFDSRGWQSMAICHHLGLRNEHKGFFRGWAQSEVLHYLNRLSSDPDICLIYYYIVKHLETFSSLSDSDRNEVEVLQRTSPMDEVLEKNWIQNTLLKGTDDTLKIDSAILSLPSGADSSTRIVVRNTECFIRNATIMESVKSLYDYRCQICGDVVLRSGWHQKMARKDEWKYLSADVHHILPLSEGGPDDRMNMLCLCPTCHRKFHSGQYRIKSGDNAPAVKDELLDSNLPLLLRHEIRELI